MPREAGQDRHRFPEGMGLCIECCAVGIDYGYHPDKICPHCKSKKALERQVQELLACNESMKDWMYATVNEVKRELREIRQHMKENKEFWQAVDVAAERIVNEGV